MATGALDANGIWQYGEDDSEPTFSGMLNKLASSTSTTVTRLEELSGLTAAQLTTHRDNLGVGLVNVVPTSVAQAGGSASANAQGLVTFTGVTSVSLNGVFSSGYKNYRVVITVSSGTATGIANFRFRAAGVDTATGYYQGDIALRTNTATATNSGENITAMYAVYFGTTANSNFSGSFDVYSPNLAARSSIVGLSHGTDASSLLTRVTGTSVNNTTVYDGFSLIPNAGSMTGSVQVFGYND